jgi:Protein of unknown function (DUF3575)
LGFLAAYALLSVHHPELHSMQKHTLQAFSLLFIALFGMRATAIAQDTLFYVNGTRIVGAVEEIGLDQVRYHTTSAGNPVAIVVPKSELARVKLAGGQEIVLAPVNAGNAAPEVMARKHAVKVDFIAPALNHFVIGYEHVLGARTNLEFKVGLIGLGAYGDYRDQHGFMAKAGVKFILRTRRNRSGSVVDEGPLAGFYLRPELMLSSWQRNDLYYIMPFYSSYAERRSVRYTSAALNVVVGRQFLLGKRITFDMYTGLGYGAQWVDPEQGDANSYYSNGYREGYAFSHAYFGSRGPLTCSAGLLFGYAF